MLVPRALLFLQRQVREDARGLLIWLVLGANAAVAAVALWLFTEDMYWRTAPGRGLLWVMAWLDYVALFLLGIGQFTAAIIEEKEAQTLGLLRLAGVGPWSILLGKLGNRLLLALLLLTVQAPFLLLAVSLGGVGLGTVLAALALIGLLILKIAGVALVCSVLCRTRVAAGGLALVLLGLGEWGGYLLGGLWWLATEQALPSIDTWLVTSTWYRLVGLSSSLGEVPLIPTDWWADLAVAAAGLLAARLLFHRYATDTGVEDGGGWIARLRQLPGMGAGRAWVGWPILWKDFHHGLGGRPVLLLRVLLILILAAWLAASVFAEYRQYQYTGFYPNYVWKSIGGTTYVVGGLLFLVEVGRGLSRLLSSEKSQLTLAALVTTPQPLHLIVFSKFWAAVTMALPFAVTASLGSILLGECDEEELWQASIAFACWGIAYWNLCALFALVIRWAGFAAALLSMVLIIMLQIFVIIETNNGSDPGIAIMLIAMLTAAASFLLWFPLMARLRALTHELG